MDHQIQINSPLGQMDAGVKLQATGVSKDMVFTRMDDKDVPRDRRTNRRMHQGTDVSTYSRTERRTYVPAHGIPTEGPAREKDVQRAGRVDRRTHRQDDVPTERRVDRRTCRETDARTEEGTHTDVPAAGASPSNYVVIKQLLRPYSRHPSYVPPLRTVRKGKELRGPLSHLK